MLPKGANAVACLGPASSCLGPASAGNSLVYPSASLGPCGCFDLRDYDPIPTIHSAGAAVLQEPEGPEAVHDWWSRHPSSWTQSDALIAAGAMVVARARAAVKEALGFTCSAGIAHSKILAKLGSGLHKPAQQTVVPGEPEWHNPAFQPIKTLTMVGWLVDAGAT